MMRRSVLLTLAALGAMLSLVSAGLFAALSDTARTGTNDYSTVDLPGSADLQIAMATPGSSITCGTFSDNLAGPLISLTDQVSGADSGEGYWYCLRNVGSQTVTVRAAAEDLTDVETACTGDEPAFDQSCSPMAEGELSEMVHVTFTGLDCTTALSVSPPSEFVALDSTVQSPVAFGTIAPQETRCFQSGVYVSGSTAAQRQAAQTDRLTWRFAFTGSV